jgi:hypothetical protein
LTTTKSPLDLLNLDRQAKPEGQAGA